MKLNQQKNYLFIVFTVLFLCVGTAKAAEEMICDPVPKEIWVREKGELSAFKHRVTPEIYFAIKSSQNETFTLSDTPEVEEKSPKEYIYVKDVLKNPVIKIVRGNNGITDITFAGNIKDSTIVEDKVQSITGTQNIPGTTHISNWYFNKGSGMYGKLHRAAGYLKNDYLVEEGSYYICGKWEECESLCSVS